VSNVQYSEAVSSSISRSAMVDPDTHEQKKLERDSSRVDFAYASPIIRPSIECFWVIGTSASTMGQTRCFCTRSGRLL
jgi:hypothetical protein